MIRKDLPIVKITRANAYTAIKHLMTAFIKGYPSEIANFLSYVSTGGTCDDCDEHYTGCTCEGENGSFCKECDQNYCICDYDLWNEWAANDYKVRKTALKLAKKYQAFERFKPFTENAIISSSFSKSEKTKLLDLLNL